MTAEAENTGENPVAETAPASEQAPSVPKWRLDELIARNKAQQEELQVKNQLLEQLTPRNQAQQLPQGPTAEELGFEPQTMQAMQKVIDHRVNQRLQQAEGSIKGHLANVSNQNEELRFLVDHGKEKAKYLPRIAEQRKKHFAMTGGYQSVDDAFKIVHYDELMAAQAGKKPQAAAQVQQTQAQTPVVEESGGVPDQAQTRSANSTGGAGKTFRELTMEEQEAALERRFAAGEEL